VANNVSERKSQALQEGEKEVPRKRWTVMVFMGAGSIDGDAPLKQYADADVAEMREVRSDGAGGALNIFVQIHGLGPATREWVGIGKPEPVPDDNASVQDGTALLGFIEWSMEKSKNSLDDYCLLVLWGHAYRFAIGRQETPSGVDAVDFGELGTALVDFQDRMREIYGDPHPRLDVVGFDACDIATLEMANQLERFADYMIGSQIGIPLPGWPYKTLLERLKTPRGPYPMTPADFGSFAVREFCTNYGELGADRKPRPVSLTLLDLRLAAEAFDAAEMLARALAQAAADDLQELEIIQEQFVAAQTIDGKPFIDVADFCLNLSRWSGSSEVQDAAAQLGDILIRPGKDGIAQKRDARRKEPAGQEPRGSFIVEHARNSHETAKLQGVSLYAPHILGDAFDWRTTRFWYNKFDLKGETYWSRLVHVLAEGD
jgi:hypothetical protein